MENTSFVKTSLLLYLY